MPREKEHELEEIGPYTRTNPYYQYEISKHGTDPPMSASEGFAIGAAVGGMASIIVFALKPSWLMAIAQQLSVSSAMRTYVAGLLAQEQARLARSKKQTSSYDFAPVGLGRAPASSS